MTGRRRQGRPPGVRATGFVLAGAVVLGLGWLGGTVQASMAPRALDLARTAAGLPAAGESPDPGGRSGEPSGPSSEAGPRGGAPDDGTTEGLEAARVAGEARTTGVYAAIAVLNEALRTGDTTTLSAIVPAGETYLTRSLVADVEALRAVPFTKVAYRWVPSRWTAPDNTWSTLPDGSVVAVVERVYSLGDPTQVVEPVEMVFEPHPGGWLLADKPEPVDDVPPEPWWTGPLVAERRGDVLVLGDERDAKRLRTLARVVDREWAATRRTWRLPRLDGPLVVYATRSPWFQDAWLGKGAGVVNRPDETDDAKSPTTFVGAVVPRRTQGGRADPAVLRVMLGTEVVRSPESFEARATISHELVHVATGLIGGRELVAWVTEGVADLQSGIRLAGSFDEEVLWRSFITPAPSAKALRAGRWEPGLELDDRRFYTGAPEAVAVNYHDALVTTLYLRQRYGAEALDRFVRRALDHDGGPEGVTAAYTAALDETFTIDAETLRRQVAEYGNTAAERYGLTTG